MPDPKPGKLRKGDRTNFGMLKIAFRYDQVALVSAVRKKDNAKVALVCAMQTNKDGTITPVPYAVMIEGNPFEDFYDPTVLGEENESEADARK